MPEYLLPDVGEGLTEAEIVSWKVEVGDTIAVNDVVVEIETAKSLVELPSPYAGTVAALLVPEGETVPVGTPIIRIDAEGEAQGAEVEEGHLGARRETGATPEIDLSNPAASGGGEGESLVGRMKADRGPQRRPRKGSASPASEPAAATQMQVQGAFSQGVAQSDEVVEPDEPAVPAIDLREERSEGGARPLAKPPVRALAKQLGVDLGSVPGSGADGVITREDVERAAAEGGRAASGAVAPGGRVASASERVETPAPITSYDAARERREPIKGVRKMMAGAMASSAFTAPHVTEWVQVDATRTLELVAELKRRPEFEGVRVSPLLVLARAAVLALGRTPEVNSVWDDAAQELVFRDYVNLGIAAATPRGLIVPNLKEAQSLNLVALAKAIDQATATAREGRTQPEEYAHGTFTITNVGVFGVDGGTPIINPGESAILCFGAIRKQPWVVTNPDTGVEGLAVRDVTTLALSFDHRHIDGEKGSRFLMDVARIVENPGSATL